MFVASIIFILAGIMFYILLISVPKSQRKHRTKLPDDEVQRIASAMCRARGEDPASQPGWKYYEKDARIWLGAMKCYEDSKHDH
jgi:hypothetical protein